MTTIILARDTRIESLMVAHVKEAFVVVRNVHESSRTN